MSRTLASSFFMMALITLAGLPNAFAQRLNLEPGLWEYTNELRMGESGEPRVQVFEGCVTQAQLDDGDFMLQDIEACDMIEQRISENQMNYVMNCQGPEGTSIAIVAEIKFNGDTAEGTIQNTVSTPMGDLAMSVNVSARRIGECDETEEG